MNTLDEKFLNGTQTKALALLGQGIKQEHVSIALGVDPSEISQLMSQPEFAALVAEARFKHLAKHNERDNKYDEIEDKLIDRLDDVLPMIMRPGEILKALQIINSQKRRGSSAPETIQTASPVVQLVMPTQIIQQYAVNSVNQVVKAGSQELVTMQSGSMESFLEERKKAAAKLVQENLRLPARDHVPSSIHTPPAPQDPGVKYVQVSTPQNSATS